MARSALVICYGNPGRGDDGLGPALAAELARDVPDGVTLDCDYQLTVDHARLIARHDIVVFADAALGLDAPFRFTPIGPAPPQVLGSHQVSPEAALALAEILFGRRPPGWILGIAGEAFGDMHEGLSVRARANLGQAAAFLRRWLTEQGLRPGCPADAAAGSA